MPSWLEFAWAAFLYGAIGGDRVYQELMNNQNFLSKLRNSPEDLGNKDIRQHLIGGFLNRWKCRLGNSAETASKIRDVLVKIQPMLRAIAACSLRSPLSTNISLAANSPQTLEDTIAECYSSLYKCAHGLAATATSKLLHILNPHLFVMWDKPILDHYRRRNSRIKDTGEGFALFHARMQAVILGVDQEFANLNHSPKANSGQLVEDYLTARMKYSPPKTIAKFADEYNWVVITNRVVVPPNWHP